MLFIRSMLDKITKKGAYRKNEGDSVRCIAGSVPDFPVSEEMSLTSPVRTHRLHHRFCIITPFFTLILGGRTMDMATAFSSLNWWAILTATVAAFGLGSVWYSPLMFGNVWMKVAGMTEESVKQANMAKIFGGSIVLTLIAAVNLGMFLGPNSDLAFGIAAGAATGIGWIVPAFGVVYFFEQRPTLQWFINGAYWVVTFIIMGAIIGAWH